MYKRQVNNRVKQLPEEDTEKNAKGVTVVKRSGLIKDVYKRQPQYVILEPEAAKGKWHQIFGNDNPIHIEVGSGKGAFITGMAQQNPDINYIGIDIQLSVLSYALDKVLASGVENVKLLRVDGSALTNYRCV